jgi:hypothetical protein
LSRPDLNQGIEIADSPTEGLSDIDAQQDGSGYAD